MQRLPRQRLVGFAIGPIANDRAPDRGEVHANLLRARGRTTTPDGGFGAPRTMARYSFFTRPAAMSRCTRACTAGVSATRTSPDVSLSSRVMILGDIPSRP